MKSNIKYICIIIVFGIFWLSCRKEDKYFINPNTPTTATPQTILTSIEVSTINIYESELARISGIMVQHDVGVDGQATQTQVYNLTESSFDNQWGQAYQTLLAANSLITNFGAGNPYYRGITNIIMAMNWGILTDMWGDIPFTQALQGVNNLTPQYDAQQTVLIAINNMLDNAINDLASAPTDNIITPGSDDLIFFGDASLWTKTAYTLKARYLNRLSNKPNYSPSDILAALSNGITSSLEDCMGIHGEGGNEHNQWIDFLNSRAYLAAGEPLVDSMSLRPQDLRLYYYFDSTGLGAVIGSSVTAPDPSGVSYWGTYLAGSAATPTPLVTFMEAKFIEAEVNVRQGDPTAFIALNEAITASALKVTSGAYTGADIATYTAANTDLGRVMYEKWIAMFGQCETYNDYRRTGLPNLTPNPNGVINVIPKRFPTPQAERTGNPNAPTPPLTEPVWWATP